MGSRGEGLGWRWRERVAGVAVENWRYLAALEVRSTAATGHTAGGDGRAVGGQFEQGRCRTACSPPGQGGHRRGGVVMPRPPTARPSGGSRPGTSPQMFQAGRYRWPSRCARPAPSSWRRPAHLCPPRTRQPGGISTPVTWTRWPAAGRQERHPPREERRTASGSTELLLAARRHLLPLQVTPIHRSHPRSAAGPPRPAAGWRGPGWARSRTGQLCPLAGTSAAPPHGGGEWNSSAASHPGPAPFLHQRAARTGPRSSASPAQPAPRLAHRPLPARHLTQGDDQRQLIPEDRVADLGEMVIHSHRPQSTWPAIRQKKG